MSKKASIILLDAGRRVFDIAFSCAALIFALPIIVCAAIAIRLETPGNPFFMQKRAGKGGRLFTMFKLRGMYIDARERHPHLYDYSKFEGLNFYFHHETDPRVTRVGEFIRRASIDELPNFLNVIIGDMTLVGPRPEIPDVLSKYGKKALEYTSVKPGITCLSKISGRDRLTKNETIEMDLDYIKRRSLALDAKILWKTATSVISRENVFGRKPTEIAATPFSTQRNYGRVERNAAFRPLESPDPVYSDVESR